MLKYNQRYQIQIVDQWRNCYLNYQFFDQVTKLIRDNLQQCVNLNRLLGHKMIKKTSLNLQIEGIEQYKVKKSERIKQKKIELEQYQDQFKENADKANKTFMANYQENLKLYVDFTDYKYKQIINNFSACKSFYQLEGTAEYQEIQQQFILYLEQLYTEAHFLSQMIRSNLQALNRIVQKHRIFCHQYYQTKQPSTSYYFIKMQKCNGMKRQIQLFYIQVNNRDASKARQRISLLAREVQYNQLYQSFFIGILGGTIITIIVFTSVILYRSQVSLEIDPIFNQQFPLWRGISHFIFYIWMLGCNIFYFERYKISHKIILENRHIRYPKSNDLFKLASFFSVIFVICFIIYALQLADIIETNQFAPEWLPLFVWIPFILFLFNPLPCLYWQGRKYLFQMLFKVIKSIILPADFLTAVTIVQLFSLISGFQDTVYTICFYTHLKLPFPLEQIKQQDVCKYPANVAKFSITIILYSLRMLYCLKEVIGSCRKQWFFKTLDFRNFIRLFFGLATTVLSYLWRDANNQQIFPAWLVCAIITAIYSFIWDTKITFDVLNLKSRNFLLRDEIIFPKINYYVWIILTFILRCTWALFISPNIVKNLFSSPQLFILALGYLQILRRGIQNIIRIEVEQIKNRRALRAVSKQKQILQQKFYNFLQKTKKKQQKNGSVQSLMREQNIFTIWRQKRSQNKKIKQQIIQLANSLYEKQQSEKKQISRIYQITEDKIKYLIKNIY